MMLCAPTLRVALATITLTSDMAEAVRAAVTGGEWPEAASPGALREWGTSALRERELSGLRTYRVR